MVLSEAMTRLALIGVPVTESQIRWAIRTNKVARPHMDGSLRFDFSEANLAEIAMHFSPKLGSESASCS